MYFTTFFSVIMRLTAAKTIRQQIIDELWNGLDPLESFQDKKFIDNGYPHTNVKQTLVDVLLNVTRPFFVLEVGSMLGGSAKILAGRLKVLGHSNSSVVCVDPFTGDVNMWAWERKIHEDSKWSFLNVSDGRVRIYDRFGANMVAAGFQSVVVPISVSSIVGMRLIHRLVGEKRLSTLPQIIYLDSAHEENETLLELHTAWSLLVPGGVLFGDDWRWNAVKQDVLRFARNKRVLIDEGVTRNVSVILKCDVVGSKVLVYQDQWVLFKSAKASENTGMKIFNTMDKI